MPDDPDIHPLLRRQARRAGIDDVSTAPDEGSWSNFLKRISGTYESADRDRYLLERSLELSSSEMQELHTKLRDDKELLDSVLSALSSGICHIDREWTIRFINAAGRRLLRHFDETPIPVTELFAVQTSDGQLIEWERVERILASGRVLVEEDIVIVRADGTRLPAAININPMMRGEELAGAVLSIRDISERKRAMRAVHEAKIEAAAAEQAREAQAAFLANMSHELRTPLNAVLGYAELVVEDAEDLGYDEVVPDLQKIHTAGRHLLSLINDVLDMSKIQSGRFDLQPEKVDLAALLEELGDTIRPLATKRGNELVLDVEDIGYAYTDHLRLVQALLNVAGNANKFTHDGRIVIRGRGDDDGVIVEIEDDGIGMEEEVSERMFEPFMQADPSTTRQYGGTGLGLAITKNICETLQLDLTVESEPGEGSLFRFRIPRTLSSEVRDPEPLDWPSEATLDPLSVAEGSRTVLLIDDDVATHDLIGRYLENEGIELVTAQTGSDGIRLARECAPDAIILDIILPDVEGWEVLSILKSDHETASIPLLVVSIIAEAPRAFQLGAQDYLVKPVERERLVATLEKYGSRHRKSRVLVVEDDDDLRHLMCTKIERNVKDWVVLQARSGREACQRLESSGLPDLILLDLMMPEMDGFQFLEVVRSEPAWQDVPIVVVTAMELTERQREELNQRVERVIDKGNYSPRRIAETIVGLLDESPPHTRMEVP